MPIEDFPGSAHLLYAATDSGNEAFEHATCHAAMQVVAIATKMPLDRRPGLANVIKAH
jgi:hypothetical protein